MKFIYKKIITVKSPPDYAITIGEGDHNHLQIR